MSFPPPLRPLPADEGRPDLGPAIFEHVGQGTDWNMPEYWMLLGRDQPPVRPSFEEVQLVLAQLRKYGLLAPATRGTIHHVHLLRLGSARWLLHGPETGEPTVVFRDGDTRAWFWNGAPHREDDLPAMERDDGSRLWYERGLLHRQGDRPARILGTGETSWWLYGKGHRNGDLPAVIYDGSGGGQAFKTWMVDGKKHRDAGPAVVAGNGLSWYLDGNDCEKKVRALLNEAAHLGCYFEIIPNKRAWYPEEVPEVVREGAYVLVSPAGKRMSRPRTFPRAAWLQWMLDHAHEHFPALAAALRAKAMHDSLHAATAGPDPIEQARRPAARRAVSV